MPPDSGLAFVLVQHLSPDFKSLMDELLSRHTGMALYRVEEGMPLEPNAVYLIPPKKNLVLSKDVFQLTDQDLSRGHPPNFPIDMFLRSLAENLRERSICVILSGSGSDGTRGVRSVHEVGGVVLVEDPETAQLDGMPRSAIATGLADYVLPAGELARVIYDYAKKAPGELTKAGDKAGLIGEAALEEITSIVSCEQQIDFSHYKRSTLGRRIERRRTIAGCDTVDAYIRLLQESQDERVALRNDLLIRVTSFFRDAEAWAQLAKLVMPRLVAQTAESAGLRIWVTACSTGEEAYSLAMLAQEALEAAGKSVDVKIFATDIDGAALQKAASGVYPENITQDVSAQRVRRFFKKQGESYQVTRQLREMIIFAQHNLMRDAPFTRMHLVTCRNTLIYIQPQLQYHVLGMLHFALQPQGILFLGAAETVGDLEQEFATIHQKWKIFEKARDVRLPLSRREPLTVRGLYAPAVTPPRARVQRQETLASEGFGAFLRGDQAICLLVAPNRELLQVFGDPRRLLHVPEGKATGEVTKMVPKELALPLNTALHKARKDEAPVAYRGLEIKQDGQSRYVDLRVTHHPSSDVAPEFFMILLQDAPASSATSATTDQFDADSQSAQRITDLEQDLQQTKESLQATIEELETTNEEQQATNQEMLASNEELQSTNEELQSVNEELYTVNAEYQNKIQELIDLNNDMDNLLRSTEIGTVFLDQELRIRKFTPAATNVINLLEHDVGRPIDHITYGINIDRQDLLEQVKSVLETDSHVECDIESRTGAALLMRIDPYRNETGETDGVVLTFVDITERKRAQERFHGLLESAPDAMVIVDSDGKIVVVNAQTERLFGHDRQELLGQHTDMLFPERFSDRHREQRSGYFARPIVRSVDSDLEIYGLHKDGTEFPVEISLSPFGTEDGALVVSAIRDVSERKRAEEAIDSARCLTSELSLAEDRQRRRIAAHLHDEIGSTLAAAKINLGRLKESEPTTEARQALSEVRGLIETAIKSIRSLTFDLAPPILYEVGLEPALESLADEIQERHGIQGVFEDDGQAKPVGAELKVVLHHAVRELLANVAKHAQASSVHVSIRRDGANVRIRVEDDGIGFEPPKSGFRVSRSGGFGLFHVGERLTHLGGQLDVESQPGHGTAVTVVAPLAAASPVNDPTAS
jgi:two-component system CheB/CheR fusion protein